MKLWRIINKYKVITGVSFGAIVIMGLLIMTHKKNKSHWSNAGACLRVAITKLYDSYDPTLLLTTDHVFVIQNLAGKLIEVGEDNSLYSAIAESWHVSSDKRVYRLKLSDTARFSNGDLITIDDVVASLKRQLLLSGTHIDLRKKILGGENLKTVDSEIKGIRALSARELEIEITHSDERFLFWIAFPETVILPQSEARKLQGQLSFAVTSGPFFLKPSKGYLHLEKNPYYYYRHGTAASCIHLYGYEVPEAVADDFFQKKLDVLDYGAAYAPSFEKFIHNDDYNVVTSEAKALTYFVFNTRTPAAAKAEARRWISRQIRPDALIPYGKNFIFTPANQFLISTHQGYLSSAEVAQVTDNALAIKPEISKLRVLYPEVFGKSYLAFLKQALHQQLGIPIEIVPYVEGNVEEALKKSDWDIAFLLVGMGEKATNILLGYHFRGINPIYTWQDSIIGQAMEVIAETDSEVKRVAQFKIISEQLLRQAYIIPVAAFKWPVITRSDLYFEKINEFQWGNPIWTLSWKQ